MTGKTAREVLVSMVTTLRPWPARHERRASVHRALVQAQSAAEQQQASEAARARADLAAKEIKKIANDNPAITAELARNLRGAR